MAMAGFLTSIVEEFITGKGTLQQIGLLTPNPALFGFLLVLFGGLTAYATARTIYRATNKEMTAKLVPPLSGSGAKPGILAHMLVALVCCLELPG